MATILDFQLEQKSHFAKNHQRSSFQKTQLS